MTNAQGAPGATAAPPVTTLEQRGIEYVPPGAPAKVVFIIVAMAIQAVLPVLGHAAVLKVLRWLAIPFIVLFAVLAGLAAGKVNLHIPPHGASWGAMTIFLALVISAGGLGWTENANDYSRYLPRGTGRKGIVLAVAIGGAVPSALLEILGAAVATGVPSDMSATSPPATAARSAPTSASSSAWPSVLWSIRCWPPVG